MTERDNHGEKCPEESTLKGWLQVKVDQYKELQKQSEQALLYENNSKLYVEHRRQVATIVSELAYQAKEMQQIGVFQIPVEVLRELEYISSMGKQTLENPQLHYTFMLYQPGSKDGDPDFVERIINSLK